MSEILSDNEYDLRVSEKKIITDASDPTIDSLCGKIDKGKLEVQADFQRKYVWKNKPIIKSRLIESVLLGIPIPIIYTAEDEKTQQELVIDGQQRLLTFHGFINNKFKLTGLSILKELNGCYYKDLSNIQDEEINKIINSLGDLQDRIGDKSIRVIKILKESHPDIKFEIFQRLNQGSVKLSDQELRNCIYRGTFNDLIKSLAENQDLLRLQRFKKPHLRMKDVERILRFFAFCDLGEKNYKAPQKKFLNDYMKSKRNILNDEIEKKKKEFKKCIELCQTVFGDIAFKRIRLGNEHEVYGKIDSSINEGILDIQLYGFYNYQKKDIIPKAQDINEAFIDLVSSDMNFIETIEKGTYGTYQVQKRTEMWQSILSKIVEKPMNDPRFFTYEEKKMLYGNNDVCQICKNRIFLIEDAHVDHIERYSEGGKTKISNARLTHRFCNLQRG